MTNLYRFCIVILFASLSFSFAGEVCRQVLDEDAMTKQKTPGIDRQHWAQSCPFNGYCNEDGAGASVVRDGYWTWTMSYYRVVFGDLVRQSQHLYKIAKYEPIYKEICEDIPESPQTANELLDAWNKCESGKASPLFVGSPDQLKWLNGRPVKKLMCDQPPIDAVIYFDSWDDYANDRNPKIPDFNDKGPDEPEKPVDPTDPTNPTDPTDPTNPTDPTDPTNPTDPGDGNGNGKGLTKGDVTEAIKDALECTAALCGYNFADSAGDAGFSEVPKSFWEQKYDTTLTELYNEKIVKEYGFVSELSNMNVDIGPGKCPVFDLGVWGEFQPNCDFLDLIRMANIFSATFFAFMLVFRR